MTTGERSYLLRYIHGMNGENTRQVENKWGIRCYRFKNQKRVLGRRSGTMGTLQRGLSDIHDFSLAAVSMHYKHRTSSSIAWLKSFQTAAHEIRWSGPINNFKTDLIRPKHDPASLAKTRKETCSTWRRVDAETRRPPAARGVHGTP